MVFLDFLLTMGQLILRVWQESHNLFYIATGTGIVLGGLTWWIAYLIVHHINLQFPFRLQHHFCCFLAALLTLIFTLLFFASRYTGVVAEGMVITWETAIQVDKNWRNKIFIKAYDAVYDLKDPKTGKQLEDFKETPHPRTGKDTLIPTNHDRSIQAVSEVYAKGAVEHFNETYPFLSKIMWARSKTSKESILHDIKRVFEGPEKIYQLEDAIRLAGKNIKKELKNQVPQVLLFFRIILGVTFFLVQSFTIGLLVWAAHRDIKTDFPKQQ